MATKKQSGRKGTASDFEARVRQQYAKLKKPEVSFEKFLKIETEHWKRQQAAAKYKPRPGNIRPCENGNFEGGLDQSQWQAAWGSLSGLTNNLTEAFVSGSQADTNPGHHTWVSAGMDPTVKDAITGLPVLSMTAPGSSNAVRIGNSTAGLGAELLSKTFVVQPGFEKLTFWYAVVFQDPGHGLGANPFFWVRVSDGNGYINNPSPLVDLGNGSDRCIADQTNPFFTVAKPKADDPIDPKAPVLYRPWSCAQIDLSSRVNQTVTIEFITGDCAGGWHWGYAYIDRLCTSCAGSPTGYLSYDCEASTHCGRLCFDYELPKAVNAAGLPLAAKVELKLQIFQDGVLVYSFPLVTQDGGKSYCFDVNPGKIPNLNMSLPGFDFVVTATFFIRNLTNTAWIQTSHQTIGSAPDGVNPGQNNDFKVRCRSCEEIAQEQAMSLNRRCRGKKNHLKRTGCYCPDPAPSGVGTAREGDCGCGKGTATAEADAESPVDAATTQEHEDCGCGGKALKAEAHAESDCGCGKASSEERRFRDDCRCRCQAVAFPDLRPCISVSWGDSDCDCLETNDVEILCIRVCNCYSNVTFSDLTINQVVITDMNGHPVPNLPDGTPSVQVIPSGPICFGDIGPCNPATAGTCISRELVLYTRGAIGRDYKLSFEGVCYGVTRAYQTEQCFIVPLCRD